MDGPGTSFSPSRIARWPVFIGLILLAGLAVRLFEAWAIQYTINSDGGIVQLMVRHIARGADFPVFFYGQPYLGSLEPALGALLCRWAGVTPFTTCLGTVFLGALLLPLVYFWAREAGGRRAGLVALLLITVGSPAHLLYSAAPRGSYMAMMVSGVATLYLACRTTTRLRAGRRVSPFAYAALGLTAGLGWWSHQLTVVFLLAAGLVLATALSRRSVRKGALPTLLAFLVGGSPWWSWNALHGWPSLSFGESLGRVSLGKGLTAFVHTLFRALGLDALHGATAATLLAFLVLAVGLFLCLTVRDRLRHRDLERFAFRLAAPLVLAAMMAVSVSSRFILFEDNGRYLLPVLPALAVILGALLGRVLDRWPAWAGGLVVFGLVLSQGAILLRTPAEVSAQRQYWEGAAQAADRIAALGDGVCLGDYNLHWLNFVSDERLCVATSPIERYAPYARRAELAARPAVLNNYLDVHAFLAYSGGTCRERDIDGFHVDYALAPPRPDWRYLDAAAIRAIDDSAGRSHRAHLLDDTMNTVWSVILRGDARAELIFEFDAPRDICGLRFVSRQNLPPGCLRIEGQRAGDSNWVAMLPWTTPGGYFWSGPYLKLEGRQSYEEVRLHVPSGGVQRVRLEIRLADARPRTVSLDEVLFLERAPAPPDTPPTPDACAALLHRQAVKQFWGPRWMTERLADILPPGTVVDPPASLSRSVQDLPVPEGGESSEITFGDTTGLLMDSRDAPRSRRVLARCGRPWEEFELGSSTLFVVSPAPPGSDVTTLAPAFWTEQGCFAQDDRLLSKPRAEALYRSALDRLARGDAAAAIALLRRATTLYPCHSPAGKNLAATLRSAGRTAEAAAEERILSKQVDPPVPARIAFANGIEFLGFGPVRTSAAPGESLDVVYFWKCPPAVEAHQFAVFVNVQKEKTRFQGDHVLCDDIAPEDLRYQPFEEVFACTNRITVPDSASPGDYTLWLGLSDRISHERLRPRTRLANRKDATLLPVVLKVVPERATE